MAWKFVNVRAGAEIRRESVQYRNCDQIPTNRNYRVGKQPGTVSQPLHSLIQLTYYL